MEVAKVFSNGGGQAVRLPKNCRFEQDEVLANRIGNIVILMPKDDPWASMLQGLDMFSESRGQVPRLISIETKKALLPQRMCTYAAGKEHEKSRGLIRVSVPGYVMVNIQFDDPNKWEFVTWKG